jgi:hypothetical protein
MCKSVATQIAQGVGGEQLSRKFSNIRSARRAEVRSMLSGFWFLLFFGALWLIIGTLGSHMGRPGKLLVTLFICAITGGLAYVGLSLFAGQPTAYEQNQWAQIRGPFITINVVQYLTISLVVFFAIRRHRQDLILVLISAVVAIHFIFLAPLFTYRIYYLTAAAILAADGLAMAMPPTYRGVLASIATGGVLWGTSLLLLQN